MRKRAAPRKQASGVVSRRQNPVLKSPQATNGQIRYFAYGSNMCTSRLRARVPSCEVVTTARLLGYKLCFHKRSRDQSAKCNAFETGSVSDVIWGVVFNIPPSEKRRLDRAEGLGNGYNEKTIDVITRSGGHVTAITYYADKTAIAEGLSPYSWYKS